MIYRLCYVDPNEPKAYFTSDWENQWGDDWDDAPYEHNAGLPYTDNSKAKSLGVWDGCEHYPKIPQKMVFFELPYGWKMPCSDTINSIYSVKDINNHRVPWITYNGNYIFAGTSYTNFIKQIEQLGGIVYLPKRKENL